MTIVSRRVEQTRYHFVDGRTQPCTDTGNGCEFDHALVGSGRYTAILAVQVAELRKPCLLFLTKTAVNVEARLLDEQLDLRGLTLHVRRLGENHRVEMHARLLLDVPRKVELPAEIDVRYAVERMWAADNRPNRPAMRNTGIVGKVAAEMAAGLR